MIRHFGMLIPFDEHHPVETEYSPLLPETLQLHAARLGKDGTHALPPEPEGGHRLPVEDWATPRSRRSA